MQELILTGSVKYPEQTEDINNVWEFLNRRYIRIRDFLKKTEVSSLYLTTSENPKCEKNVKRLKKSK